MKSNLKKMWSILTPYERRKSLVMIVLVVLMALAETIGVMSIMPFLSVLARPDIIQENAGLLWLYEKLSFASSHQFITVLGLSSIVLVIGASAFKTITLHLLNRFTFLLRHSISARLLSGYLRQPYNFFLVHNPSELTRNVLSEIDQLQNGLIKPLSQLIAQGAVALAMMLLLFFYNPWIAISAAVVVGLLYGAIYILVRKRLDSTGQARQVANGDRFQVCSEVLGGIKDVKITHAVEAYQKKFNHASREYSRHQANAETLSQSPLYIVETVGYTGLVVLALILMKQNGDIGQVLPVLGLYGFAAFRLLPSVQIMYRGFAQLKFSSAAMEVIYCHLNLPAEEVKRTQSFVGLQKELRLENIHYAYPSTPGAKIFDGFNLTIKANTILGIKGQSGTGKSTLMDILLGLLQGEQGRLIIDDAEITSEHVYAWQKSIGYVPQHVYLADTSVAENIAFGVNVKMIDQSALEKAARAAQIHDFVVGGLEQGYSTMLGERGIRLSGGQRQRIGIARALYHDPGVLFMDEATSALDDKTEAALNDAISALSGQKTIVLIAHREESLKYCDEIVEL